MTDRDGILDAALMALIESMNDGLDATEREIVRENWDRYRREMRIAAAVVDAVEPLIRAHERTLEDVRRDMVEDRSNRLEERLLSIHRNVEHMRDMIQKYIDSQRTVPGSFIAVDVGRREALNDVLALFRTDLYPEMVGSDD